MTYIIIRLPCQSSFCISTNSTNLIELLKQWYGKYCYLYHDGNRSINCKHIEVLQYEQGYRLKWNDNIISTSNPLLEIHRIVFQNTEYTDGILALHGCAVEWNKKAQVFLAPTTAGKTTLTSFLCSHGFGYITDDCILLDTNTHKVHPYSTPIHLRKDGFSILENYNANPVNCDIITEPFMERMLYTPKICVKEPIPLERIYFMQRTENICSCETMNANEKLINLLKSPIKEYPFTTAYMYILVSLSKENCYRLFYSDMEYVEHILKS